MAHSNFNFPFEPYSIQRDFMTKVYEAIENGGVAILESPTGTGKSLSLACGALTWLRNHQRRISEGNLDAGIDTDEPAWILENARQERRDRAMRARQARESRLARARTKEAVARKHHFQGAGPSKRKTVEDLREAGTEEASLESFMLDDYLSGDDAKTKASSKADRLLGLSENTQRLLTRVGMGNPQAALDEDIESETTGPIIYFCSRTHSQLAQFAAEVGKINLQPVLPDPVPNLDSTKMNTAEETLRHLTLGSRKNLCINSKVTQLCNNAAINERCLDLQKAGLSEDKKCSYLPKKEDEKILDNFVDLAHAKIRDIEDLAAIGKAMHICPYYASRRAIQTSEIVTLPYPLLLQSSTRAALGISLKDNIVIIDEAHNLMDAISGLYSCSVSLSQLHTSREQLLIYLKRFRNMLKGRNRIYVAQCVRVLDSLLAYATELRSLKNGQEGVCDTAKLLAGKGMDQINLFKLNDYMQKSKLARKVDGYTDFVMLDSKANASDKNATGLANVHRQDPTPTLSIVQSFLSALMNPSQGGRFGYSVNSGDVVLRYMLLDPALCFKDIVDEARSVILAGGTMSPMEDYHRYLFPYLQSDSISTLSCRHIIPSTSLEVFTVSRSDHGSDFDFKFSSRSTKQLIVDAGNALIKFISGIPDGVVAFFPSYSYLEECVAVWKTTTTILSSLDDVPRAIWQELEKVKPIFLESSSSRQSEKQAQPAENQNTKDASASGSVLQSYTASIRQRKGGLLFAVMSGSLSEGINFSDELGRGVIVFGLPYPNPYSAEWKAKMNYITQKADSNRVPISSRPKNTTAAQEFYENATMRAVNQAVGRAIRHRNDYAVILLLDKRYATDRIRNKLPAWMRDSISTETSVHEVSARLAPFFKRRDAAGLGTA